MDNTVKVLHIIPGYGGGISSYVKNLISGMSKKNICIDVVSFSDYDKSFINIIELRGGRTFSIPSVHTGITKMVKAYCTILKDNQYDVVHCHISGYKGLFFMAFAKAYNVKRVLVHAHRTSDENKGLFYKLQIKASQFMTTCLATDYLTCSKMASEFIFGSRIGKSKKVHSMPNSVDVNKFTKQLSKDKVVEFYDDLNIFQGDLIIGHIGRFNLQKNHEFMIKIISELRSRNINFKWLFVGEGNLEEQIKERVNNLNLQKYVRFLGRREDIPDLIHVFNVFVLPSLFEGLPTVSIEAQAAGIPTILSDTITSEANMDMGILDYISVNNEVEWADRILNFSSKQIPNVEERRKKIQENGFTLDTLGRKYEEILLGIQ
ncbi:glycosyltransferase [Peribacillus sp. SCS-26]|uniref:glycosyltransferase n=1 Tax=Paraperibacillus marinus TaxID=3115295 RepID=UPI003905CF54